MKLISEELNMHLTLLFNGCYKFNVDVAHWRDVKWCYRCCLLQASLFVTDIKVANVLPMENGLELVKDKTCLL